MAEESNYSDLPMGVTGTGQDVSTTGFLPLDDSESSDSASDISMDADSDDDDDDEEEEDEADAALTAAAPPPPPPASTDEMEEKSARKRKQSISASENGSISDKLEPVKKVKLEEPRDEPQPEHQGNVRPVLDKSSLPAEVWHHIFSWSPPKTLGNLLQVNRLFNAYLDPSSTMQCKYPVATFKSALPALQSNDIWKTSRTRFWPGMPSPLKGQTELYMWQLICSKSCQHCGLRPSVPQVDSFPDSEECGPGTDGVAIIWAFATRSCGPCLLKKSIKEIDILLSSSIPSTLTAALPFVFVTQQLVAISPEAMQRGQPVTTGPLTKLYWSAHVDELKQEFFQAKALGVAAAEEWLKGLERLGSSRRHDSARWETWANSSGGARQMREVLYPAYRPPASINAGSLEADGKPPLRVCIPGLDSANHSVAPSQASGPSPQTAFASDSLSRSSSSGPPSHGQGRFERTKEEIAELKAARKAEIERRALSLDPPLPASILTHMPSFQAALQIITPLDDQGWEVLKPRLIAQRLDAEKREQETVARYQREMEEKRNQFVATKSARDAEDADWDEVQAPLRARIAGLADEIIRDGWDDGDKVGRDNCSKFAVEVLNYIRKRFYAEIAKDAAAARADGKLPTVDPPEGPFTQKLTLDNMKWIFDVKVRPHTEKYRKELFLCNGCDATTRYYGFEGVIQHYAAKHTNALSIGNVVVHWRAEWPETPPFTSEPKHGKAVFNQGQPPPGYNGYQPGSTQPFQTTPPVGPSSGYGAYSQGPQGPYSATSGGYAPPPTGYASNPYANTDPSYPSYGQPTPPTVGPYNYNYSAYQSNSQAGYQNLQPSPFSPQYKVQLEEMARISRDLWNATSNMKDTLSIVRVQVVVFHLARRFHAKFGMALPLSTFIDGLSNHKDMRPVRNVNGLICRVCHQGIGGYVVSEEERKSWSLPQLTSHFQSRHVEPFLQMGQYGQPPDWTENMVLLPEPSAVTNLRSAVAMDGQKYHLVNEAVPLLLAASDQSQAVTAAAAAAAAATQPSGWPDQSSYYQGYQGATPDVSAQFYGQGQASVPQTSDGAMGQFPNAAGLGSAQYSAEQGATYNYTEATAGYVPPEPAASAQSMTRTSTRQGRDQANRQSKKNRKKGGNGGRDSGDEGARKRQEEEEKMAEEEAEREAAVIRAMWAKDRANAASKTAQPEGNSNRSEDQVKVHKPSASAKPSPKVNTSQQQQQQRPRFQSRPPRGSPGGLARGSPLAGPEGQRHAQKLSHGSWRRTPEKQQGRYEAPAPQREVVEQRNPAARSPVQQYIDYGRPPPPPPAPQQQQLGGEQPRYLPRQPDDARFTERSAAVHPPPPREEYLPPRGAYPPQAPPATEYVEIEVIEYRGADGTIWVEERPLRRIPNPEAERYYHRDAPPPPAAAASAAAYERGGGGGDYPPREPYRAPPYERAYSRAPPPAVVAGPADMYDPRQPLGRNDPPPPPPPGPPLARGAPSYYEEEYDPRYPAGPPPPAAPASASASRPARYQ